MCAKRKAKPDVCLIICTANRSGKYLPAEPTEQKSQFQTDSSDGAREKALNLLEIA